MRIVVVDDEPDVRLVLALQLRLKGHEVVGEAGDGAAAVDVCAAESPDAVILDLLMPGTTGFEAIPKLQALDRPPRIVAYSAVAGETFADGRQLNAGREADCRGCRRVHGVMLAELRHVRRDGCAGVTECEGRLARGVELNGAQRDVAAMAEG